MAKREIRNWIFANTLLGWYRQCSISLYGRDVDTASWISDLDESMIDRYYRENPFLKMYTELRLKNDSLRFKTGNNDETTINLFWMPFRPAANQFWNGFQIFNESDTKLHQAVAEICTADLHGYLVYVPCHPWEMLDKAAYTAISRC